MLGVPQHELSLLWKVGLSTREQGGPSCATCCHLWATLWWVSAGEVGLSRRGGSQQARASRAIMQDLLPPLGHTLPAYPPPQFFLTNPYPAQLRARANLGKSSCATCCHLWATLHPLTLHLSSSSPTRTPLSSALMQTWASPPREPSPTSFNALWRVALQLNSTHPPLLTQFNPPHPP